MSIKVKVHCERDLYNKNGYRITAFSPLQVYNNLKINQYCCFTVKGSNFPYIDVNKDYEIEIEELSTDFRGTTYKLLSCPSVEQLDVDNLSRNEAFEILMSCTSSEKIANNILDVYPNYIKMALTVGADNINTKPIKGVGEVYNKAYCREITNKYKYFAMLNKYKDYELSVDDCKALYDMFTDIDKIDHEMKENPYKCLITCCNRSFNNADKIIINLRSDLKDSEQRCAYVIYDILDRNEYDNNTRINANEAYKIMRDEYNVPNLLPLVVNVCKNSDIIYYDDINKYLSKMSTWIAENKISDFIKNKIANSNKLDIDYTKYKDVDGFVLTDTQLNCLKNFCDYDISVLAGVAGGGKSATIKNLVKLMDDNGISYCLLSTTGKASRVLAESTGKTAMTIHKKCFQGDIDSDACIIDECSMLSIDVFCMLINAITNKNCKIILVGDCFQLASVNLGKVFFDIIESKIVPTTELTEVFRYKSNGALYVATNVRNGHPFFDDTEMVKYNELNNTYSICDNYKFIESNDSDIIDIVKNEYIKLINKGIKKQDIMILTPMNKGSLGTYALNNIIQAEVNPPLPDEKTLTRKIDGTTITFRVGSIVLNCKNDYHAVSEEAYKNMISDSVLNEEDVADTQIMNGQTGIVREILNDGMIVQFDEELIYISKSKLHNILLSFVETIHKSQGSSCLYTINIISPQHSRMHTRGLEYVADTRCKKATIDIGDMESYEKALSVADNDLRDTWLKELLSK